MYVWNPCPFCGSCESGSFVVNVFRYCFIPLQQPLTPTNAKPDMSSIRLIKQSELRRGGIIGSGAFGTVYKVNNQVHVFTYILIWSTVITLYFHIWIYLSCLLRNLSEMICFLCRAFGYPKMRMSKFLSPLKFCPTAPPPARIRSCWRRQE